MKSCFLAFTALSAIGGATLMAAPAEAQSNTQAYDFDLPAQPLSQSVLQVGSIGKVQMLYSDDGSPRVDAPSLKGRMTVDQALSRLLSGSGYTYEYTRPGVVTLRRASAEGNGDGELVTGAVRVEGFTGSPYFGGAGVAAGVNGLNGSRDITATEGTGSFTSGALTIGSKVPQSLKDVPQSVSVLTSERLEQQNVSDFTTAMKQLPGVTLVQGGTSLESIFYSRGFSITSFQVDGGAQLSTGIAAGQAFLPQIDMAQYDHVELLRGAAGLFNGYGDPSGIVNLVRKKPLDHGQFVAEAQAGSWSNYRAMVDASSPLALDGKLRGRLVMAYQDNHHFYHIAKDNKTLIYGIAEIDVTPTTLVSAGISYARQDSVPWSFGLPRYQTGADIELPRSTAFALPWSRWDFNTTELFGSIEQKIGDEWAAKFNITHNRQRSTQKTGFGYGAINPLSDVGAQSYGNFQKYSSKQLSAEATLTGAFELFGQRQEITIGANHADGDGGGQTMYSTLIGGTSSLPYQPYPGGPAYYPGSPYGATPPIDIFSFDPYDPIYNEPQDPLPRLFYPINGSVQSGAYASLRLTAFDRLHLTTGLRWSKFKSRYAFEQLCTSIPTSGIPSPYNCVGRQIGDPYSPSGNTYEDDDFTWPPPVSLSFDVTKRLVAYVGYTDIYSSQANSLGGDLKPVDPITGSNIEGGLKWAARDGRFNVVIAAYRVRKKGFAIEDGIWDYNVSPEDEANGIWGYFIATNGRIVPNGQTDPNHFCCYAGDPNKTLKSEGLDIEATGEVRRGWQISASYTYNQTKQEGGSFGTNEGLPFLSIQPKHLYKLWSSFDFGAAGETGFLSGLTLSGGVNGQTSAYRSGTACTDLNPPDAMGFSTCKPGATVPFAFTVPAYAIFSGRIDYRFSDKWSLAVNLDNIFDKTYYQTVGTTTSGNWYGAPRSVTATLRAKW